MPRLLGAALAALVFLSSPAAGQVPQCVSSELAVACQQERDEPAHEAGRTHSGQLLMIFRSPDGKRWSAWMVSPDRQTACFVMSGNGWGGVTIATVEEER